MSRFIAELLRASASGFAGLAAGRTIERVTSMEEGLRAEDADFEGWRQLLETLVLELAAAVEHGGPSQFGDQVAWAGEKSVLGSRDEAHLPVALSELERVFLEDLPSSAIEPLAAHFEAARACLGDTDRAEGGTPKTLEGSSSIERAFLERIRAGDARAAIESLVARVRDGSITPQEALGTELLGCLRRVGVLWHAGELSVAEEHFASEVAGRVISEVLALANQPPKNGRTVLLSMVEGDNHDLGIRVVSAFLELAGWRTICLGSNSPPREIARAYEHFSPDLAVLGATLNTHRVALESVVQAIRSSPSAPPILIGGPATERTSSLIAELKPDGTAATPEEAVREAQRLVGPATPPGPSN